MLVCGTSEWWRCAVQRNAEHGPAGISKHVVAAQAMEAAYDDSDSAEEQEEEDQDEVRFSPKRKRASRPSTGTPGKAESLEELEQRLQPGSVKHAIFQVGFYTAQLHFLGGIC